MFRYLKVDGEPGNKRGYPKKNRFLTWSKEHCRCHFEKELKITPLTAFGRPKSVAPDPGAPAQLEAPVAPLANPNPAQSIKTK